MCNIGLLLMIVLMHMLLCDCDPAMLSLLCRRSGVGSRNGRCRLLVAVQLSRLLCHTPAAAVHPHRQRQLKTNGALLAAHHAFSLLLMGCFVAKAEYKATCTEASPVSAACAGEKPLCLSICWRRGRA